MRPVFLSLVALAAFAQPYLSTIPQGTRTIEATLIVPTNSAINICRQSTVDVVRATAATLTIANGAGATAPQETRMKAPRNAGAVISGDAEKSGMAE